MKFLKIIGKSLLWILAVVIMLLLIPYMFTPVYNFPEAKPFSGEQWYNPYQGLDADVWQKGNFQVQSRVWGGVTDGRNNSNEVIDSTYQFLDYDIIGTSDYMQINQYHINKPEFISIYEHGYSIFKVHQIVLGAESANWLDYFFWQTPNQKQKVISALKDESDVIILAHPCLRNGYETSDLKKISGYDAMEILNFYCESVFHWDTALSSGRYVAAIGNDDVHDITNPDEVGQYCTFLNTGSLEGDSVVDAIKRNRTYAVNVFRYVGDSWALRKDKHDQIGRLEEVDLSGDSLRVSLDRKTKFIRFIGQNGILKKQVAEDHSAFYLLQPEDTYIRTEVHFQNGNVFYLNPVVRYDGKLAAYQQMPAVNLWMTWAYRIIAILLYAFLLYILYRIGRKSPKKS
ncbi:MAG: hypothetical protein U5Q03_11275 [Bacteroidota bacterium]|nr:hypothetical protein [Bacteroidota bacterium]